MAGEIIEVEGRIDMLKGLMDGSETLANLMKIEKKRLDEPIQNLINNSEILEIMPQVQLDAIASLYEEIGNIAKEDADRAKLTFEILFYPEFATTEDKTSWGEMHLKMYREKAYELVYAGEDEIKIQQIAIISGMFGGKSTLAFEIIKLLEKEGFDIQIYNTIKNGTASRNGHESNCAQLTQEEIDNYKNKLEEEIENGISKKRAVYIDEFSFAGIGEESLIDFIGFLKRNDVYVILTGLEHYSTGMQIPLVKALKELEIIPNWVEVKSFVKQVDPSNPTGNRTIRYFKIGKCYYPDFGGLEPIVVENPLDPSVRYAPIPDWLHMAILLYGMDVLDRVFGSGSGLEQEAFTRVIQSQKKVFAEA